MPPQYKIKTRGIYHPGQDSPYRISRSKIDMFTECPRCFYLDQRLGVRRPGFPAFTLNSAVDELLKREFDAHREGETAHPIMIENEIKAVPFQHSDMEKWRHNFTGVSALHKPTNFEVFGAVDDIWINEDGELHVVDYKATSKQDDPDLDGFWQQAYKRQIEVYQWLLRQNDFKVSDIGYFVYANGRKDEDAFDKKLIFDVHLISYEGDDSWIEGTLKEIKECLESEDFPKPGEYCEHCPYREAAGSQIRKHYHETGKVKGSKKNDEGKLF